MALEKEYGSMAGPWVMLGNQAAAAVARAYPNVSVDMLGYAFTEDPPTNISVGPGLVPRYAPIDVDYAFPLAQQRAPGMYSAAKPPSQLAGWMAAVEAGGSKLYTWIYYDNYHDLLMPHPMWRNVAPDIAFLASHGVRGVFAEGTGTYPSVEMVELKAWVFAQLTFDPRRNATALTQEFLDGFYSPSAAPLVRRHMDAFTNAVLDMPTPPDNVKRLSKYGFPTEPWVTPAAILESATALKRAVAGAASDYRPQLDRLYITPRYLLISRWNESCAHAEAHVAMDVKVILTPPCTFH
jgi:hypothetical protein